MEQAKKQRKSCLLYTSNLIQILNEIQETYGYISKEAQTEISEYLSIPLAEIYGVITFYSRFTLKPKGKYNIAVCLGTACFVKGSEKVLDKIKEILQIDVGQTTPDPVSYTHLIHISYKEGKSRHNNIVY